ncbi:MAG: tetratricopeptide repeat protein, partial [Thermosynechococcaceae cyanobacterium]
MQLFCRRYSLLVLLSTPALCFVPLSARSGAEQRVSTQGAEHRVASIALSSKQQTQPLAPVLMAQANSESERQQLLNEAKQLNEQVIQLYQQGRYSEAIPIAQRSLSIWEKALGPDHPDVA